MTPFGKLLRDHRAKRGLLIADQASQLSISVASVSAYETGSRTPSEEYARSVARYLCLSSKELDELLAALLHSTNVIHFKPKDRAVASLAYGIAKRLNELSPAEIHDLQKIINVDEGYDV